MKYCVGLTGNMGSGKSTVASIFRSLGIPVYDADVETKKLYNTHSDLKSKLIAVFGEQIYPNGIFDPKTMNHILVQKPSQWPMINDIVHPFVREHSQQWQARQTAVYTIRESALLYEVGLENEMDDIIVVTCPEDIRIQRVIQRSQLDEASIRSRMAKQMDEQSKIARADYVIVNDGKQALIPQVLSIHDKLLAKSSR